MPRFDPPEPRDLPECPECGSTALYEDKRDRSVECEDCEWSTGFDWDAEADRLREDELESRV